MPRFVILEHDHPKLHWDLMLEAGEVLRTWRLLAPPRVGAEVVAEWLADHRKHYLDYEGPVSGGRGQVRRWDRGCYEPDARQFSGDGPLVIVLEGERLRGTATLSKSTGGWTFRLG